MCCEECSFLCLRLGLLLGAAWLGSGACDLGISCSVQRCPARAPVQCFILVNGAPLRTDGPGLPVAEISGRCRPCGSLQVEAAAAPWPVLACVCLGSHMAGRGAATLHVLRGSLWLVAGALSARWGPAPPITRFLPCRASGRAAVAGAHLGAGATPTQPSCPAPLPAEHYVLLAIDV